MSSNTRLGPNLSNFVEERRNKKQVDVLEVTAIPYKGLTGDLLCVILGLMYKSFSLGFPLFGFKIRLPCCTTPCIKEKKLKDTNITKDVHVVLMYYQFLASSIKTDVQKQERRSNILSWRYLLDIHYRPVSLSLQPLSF